MSAPHRSRIAPPPGGFTLIELLVAISIIAVLAALITPAYFAVRRTVFENGVATDMAQMEQALEVFKSEYQFYPSDFSEFVAADGTVLDLTDVIPNSGGVTVEARMLQFLQKISPTHNELSPDPFDPAETRLEHWWHSVAQPMIVNPMALGAATKDNRLRGPQHALWFWLSQLYNDAQYPLSGQRFGPEGNDDNMNGINDGYEIVSERKVFYEFAGAQLFERDAGIEYPAPGFDYLIYTPIQRGGDSPLVYFHNDTYIETTTFSADTTTVINYEPLAVAPDDALNIAKPVRVPGSAALDGLFLEPKRFQIVSAGNDEKFGDMEDVAGFPSWSMFPSYEKLDNIASFAEGRIDGFVTRFQNP